MKRLDRRNFLLVASVGASGFVLTACGNDPDDTDLSPTMIPDVAGAPPTLAPVASPGGGATEGEPAEEPASDAGVVELEAQDPYAWSVTELEAAPGQVIRVTNTGLAQHDFTIDELSIAEELPNGEPVDITLPDDLAVGDTYTYYCAVPGHRENGMEGTLTIVEASAAAPAEEEAPADGDAGAVSGPVTLEAQDPYNWSTKELEASPGQVIQITNTGFVEHDFVIDELGINEPLPNGEMVEVTLADDLAVGDTYTFYCSIPGHRESGMEGTLTIVEGGGEAAPAEGEGEEAAPADTTDEGAAAAGPVTLEAQDPYNWSVTELEAAPGQVIEVTNTGLMEHDFVIDELGINEVLPNGEPVDITVPEDVAVGDTYTFYCSIPGHRESGMEGTLTIVEAGGGDAAAADEESDESTPAAAGSPAASEPITLEAQDPFQWSSNDISAAPGQVLHITNAGLLEHDFVVDELGLDAPLPIGEVVDVTIPDDAPVGDTYEFYCSIPGHRSSGMEGNLTIVEAGGETGATPAEGTPEPLPATPVADDVAALMEDPEVVALEATDPYNWSFKTVQAYPGQILRVLNLGVLEHDFVIDELDIKQELPFGEPIDIQVPDSVTVGDTYTYYCSIPGHKERGMEGTLVIVEVGADTGPAASASPAASPVASPAASPVTTVGDVVTLEAHDPFSWSATELEASAGQVIAITNTGFLEHDFVIDELGIHEVLPSQETVDVTLPDDLAAGDTYEFYCSVPGHRQSGMEGTLTVV